MHISRLTLDLLFRRQRLNRRQIKSDGYCSNDENPL